MLKPKKANIGTLKYQVEYVDGLQHGDQALYGHHLHSDIKIRIDSAYPEDRQRETFIHECLHAIDCRVLNDKLDEDTVAVLSSGLFDFIRQNKTAIMWVMGD